MINAKLKIEKDKWVSKLSEGLADKIENREMGYTIEEVIEAHLDGVLNEISEFDLVARL